MSRAGRPANKLHVRTYIENVVEMCEALGGSPGVPPVYRSYITEMKLYGKAILRKHAGKHSRKDIYMERTS